MPIIPNALAQGIVAQLKSKNLAAEDVAMLSEWALAIATAVANEINPKIDAATVNGGVCAPSGPVTGAKITW